RGERARPASAPKARPGAPDYEVSSSLRKVAHSPLGNTHRLRSLFRRYDPDREGTVSLHEFRHGLSTPQLRLSPYELCLSPYEDEFFHRT
ncbi:hypothetical protein T484DRAFT_1840951, partial [Baffinella frigidus]